MNICYKLTDVYKIKQNFKSIKMIYNKQSGMQNI